jgi:DNA-binding NtrC family response regulator
MADGNVIDGQNYALEDQSEEVQVPMARDTLRAEPGRQRRASSLLGQVEAFEREIIARALEAARGNQSETAPRSRS